MPSITYLFKRLCTMNYKSMFERIDIVKEKCNKSRFAIFCDMVWCGFRYGAGYVDYDVIGFYKLNSNQRKTMLTRGINNKFVRQLNEKEYWHVFNNKNEFNDLFRDFVKRDYIYPLSEDKLKSIKWIKNHNIFFAKPNDGQCGKNIEKINISDWGKDYEKLYEYLTQNKLELLEEPIIQCEEMNKLNSSSVNTVRMVTVMNEIDEVTIIAAFSRIGNGKVVDNFNSGGMTAKIDVESGKIIESAVNKKGELFANHPLTGTKINGFQIPNWEEAKEMVKKAAKLSKHIRYVGWDVGISNKGPILVEGNQFPGHDIYQVAEKIGKEEIGILPVFEKAIETENEQANVFGRILKKVCRRKKRL